MSIREMMIVYLISNQTPDEFGVIECGKDFYDALSDEELLFVYGDKKFTAGQDSMSYLLAI